MKKFALVLCLISTLLFTACGQEAAESSASIEETGFSQIQEVSETDGNAENSGYPETPETELKVNAPLAEDNEIGGIYNLVVGTYEEACDFLADTLKNLLEASVQLEYGELYHSFVYISADGSVASGMLRASYEDGYAYETVFSIANALGMDCYMSVKYDSDRETVVFNRQAMTYGMGRHVDTFMFTGDCFDRHDSVADLLDFTGDLDNTMRMISGETTYAMLMGSWDAETGEINMACPVTLNSEIQTVGQPIFIMPLSVAEQLANG